MLDVSVESIPRADFLIWAHRTNERRTIARKAAAKAGVTNDVYVFPWEEIEEQCAEIQAAQSQPG